MKPVKKELEKMARLGVIPQIKEPTEWYAGMVPVQKRTVQFVFVLTSPTLSRASRESVTNYQR